jgi:cytochrome c oxidase cbb3-type subunit I/II
MYNPRSTSPGSIMPRFPWLITNELDRTHMVDKMKLMKNSFDIPYTKGQIDSANAWADSQAKVIVKKILSEAADVKDQVDKEKVAKGDKFVPIEKREIVALIAYLQRLGTDIKTTDVQTASNN